MNPDIEELRDESRKFATKTVEVDFPCDDNKLSHFICSSQDISNSGVKLISHRVMNVGNSHCIRINLGDEHGLIEAKGEVKWCLEIDDIPTYYVGVKLNELSRQHQEKWQLFIDQL